MKKLLKRRVRENRGIPAIFDEEVASKFAHRQALLDIETGRSYTFREVQTLSIQMASYFKVASICSI